MATNKKFVVAELGYLEPGRYQPSDKLEAGEVGYIAASIKTVSDDVENIHITTDKITKRFESINNVNIEEDNKKLID